MALRLDSVGSTTRELTHSYTWKDTALYALGVGARLPGELDLLFEGRGPRVLPTYAVVPAYDACAALFEVVGGDLLGVVHGNQKTRLHAPFAPAGTLRTVGRVAGIYDLKRMAIADFATTTHDEAGTLLCETEWRILYRFDGGFSGPTPPKRDEPRTPDREPDWRFEAHTTPEQAALYRLSGDLNPLHIDPEIGRQANFGGPILHGLCTYGIVGRAVIAEECGGDPDRLRFLSGGFKKPVWPGDTLIVEGYRVPATETTPARVLVRAVRAKEPGEAVFGGGWAEIG
jgi:acyl dehydratase